MSFPMGVGSVRGWREGGGGRGGRVNTSNLQQFTIGVSLKQEEILVVRSIQGFGDELDPGMRF